MNNAINPHKANPQAYSIIHNRIPNNLKITKISIKTSFVTT